MGIRRIMSRDEAAQKSTRSALKAMRRGDDDRGALTRTVEIIRDIGLDGKLTYSSAAVVAELSRSPIDLAPRPLGEGTAVQLWPHRHGTDAMYLALLQREA